MKAVFNFIDMSTKKMPTTCPACGEELRVERLVCRGCDTAVQGEYALPCFMRLTAEEQELLLDFVECSGSLKELASRRALSYPTMRNMLDEVIAKLKTYRV